MSSIMQTYVLESVTVNLGVKVDGVFPGDNVGEGRSGLSLGGVLSSSHLKAAVGEEVEGDDGEVRGGNKGNAS